MAKGEGAEQYSNASLLNKEHSSEDLKLAKKVGLFIRLRTILCDQGDGSTMKEGKGGFCRAGEARMNGAHRPLTFDTWARFPIQTSENTTPL